MREIPNGCSNAFFGAVYYCYAKFGDVELADYQWRQFNFSFGFPPDRKHKVTFGNYEVTIENEYFKIHYQNLDPKRERYMTPQTELLLVEVEQYQPVPDYDFPFRG